MLLPSEIALAVFVAIIVIAMIIAQRLGSYSNYEGSNFHTFTAILSGLGVFVTFLFYYNIIELQNIQQKSNEMEFFTKLNKSVYSDLLIAMSDASKSAPKFVSMLMPLTPSDENLPEDKTSHDTLTTITLLSYRIFSLWQDVASVDKSKKNCMKDYLATFLQRATSKELKKAWDTGKIDFNSKTRKLGDLLFEYAASIKDTSDHQSYSDAVKIMIKDKRYNNIYEN